MGLPACRDLTALPEALATDCVHLFVVGPGTGEALAVALPGGVWLVVDSCRTGSGAQRALPLQHLIARFGGNHTETRWLLLTHPHADHAGGLAELIDHVTPSWIGVTGPDPARNLAAEVVQQPSSGSTAALLRRAAVRTAVRRINSWHHDHPGRLLGLSAGATLPDSGEVSCRCHVACKRRSRRSGYGRGAR